MSRVARRQPEQRPDAIINAAFEEFTTKGYAETRLDDVATRAGISKGLVYVYFKTKEELFKAVVRAFIVPRFEALIESLESSPLSAEEIIRGPLLDTAKDFATSSKRFIVRLLVAEGPKHPDLTEFYHREVISRGMRLFSGVLAKGVRAGDFEASALEEFPQLFAAPMLMALIWDSLFGRQHPLDTGRLLDAHVDIILRAIKSDRAQPSGRRAT